MPGRRAADAPARRLSRIASLALLAALASCEKPPEAPKVPDERGLKVLVRPGPTTWATGPDGQPAGFDHDLLVRFAETLGEPLVPTLAPGGRKLIDAIAAGEARIGAGGLYRPAPGTRPVGVSAADVAPVLWTKSYYTVEPVVIFAADSYRPRSWKDLAGATVAYVAGTGIEEAVEAVRSAHPEVRWQPAVEPSADALIADVDTGRFEYAIVAAHQAAVARNIYLNFDVAFTAGPKLELAWVLPPGSERMRDRVDAFLDQARKDGTIARFADRYFNHPREVQRIDAGVFQERLKSLLPDFRRAFQEAQEVSGIEWRLLAAMAYQESQWDPLATSETGVRGMMQLTEDTAKHLGVTDRLDARQSIDAAGRYLRDLKAKLPERIPEPDRTWLALAAYNIGLGHLEDARVLAQRQKLNPDLWSDVKKALPLLADPEHYAQAKLGYARGGMPVSFVDRVRAYYDILVRHEEPHQPRLRGGGFYARDGTGLQLTTAPPAAPPASRSAAPAADVRPSPKAAKP